MSRLPMFRLLPILFACLTFERSVFAWDAEGHMTVAQIAYNHLNAVAKARCDALIAVNLGNYYSAGTTNFVTAAPWADDFKSALGTGIWHYIDIPFSLDGTTTSGVAVESFDIVQAINLSITNLQNASLTESNRAVSLRYLIHFVGDLSQPLHCSTAVWSTKKSGDAGGNGFSLTGDWSNLHSLWDDGGGYLTDSISRPLTSTGRNILSNKVAQVETDYPYDYTATPVSLTNAMTWALESWNLARTNCYTGITNGAAPTAAYLTNTIRIAEQRMALGGHHLADLLNTLFPTPAPVLGEITVSTNGSFRFTWSAVTNVAYRVQWKQNLTDATWTDLTSITATSNTVTFQENAGSGQRFYRVAQ